MIHILNKAPVIKGIINNVTVEIQALAHADAVSAGVLSLVNSFIRPDNKIIGRIAIIEKA